MRTSCTSSAGHYALFPAIADLGCPVGGDLLALAALSVRSRVIGLNRDALHLRMAQANLPALGLYTNTHLLQADLTARLPFSTENSPRALFFDPTWRSDVFSIGYNHLHWRSLCQTCSTYPPSPASAATTAWNTPP